MESKKKLYKKKINYVNDFYGYDEFELRKYKENIQIEILRNIIINFEDYTKDLEKYLQEHKQEIDKIDLIKKLEKENEELKNKISNQDNDIVCLNKKVDQLEKTVEENKKEKENLKNKLKETNYQHSQTVSDYNSRIKEIEVIKLNYNDYLKTFANNHDLREQNINLVNGNNYLKEVIEMQKNFIFKVKENKNNHRRLINIIDEKE
jgi:chromosome segregation ATPase